MSEKKSNMTSVFRSTIWACKLVFQYSPLLLISVLFAQLATASLPFFRTKVFSQLIDALTIGSHDAWYLPFIYFVLVGVITSIFFFLHGQLSEIVDIKLQAYLREMFIGKVARLDYQHLESKDTAALISKVDEEFNWRTRRTILDVNDLVFSFMSLVAITVIILPSYPYIWILIMIMQIPQYLIEKYWVKKDWKNYDANSEKSKEMWDLNYQLRQKNYIAELRINNAIDFLVAKYNSLFEYVANQKVAIQVKKSPSEVLLSLLSNIVSGICLFIIIQDVRLGILTLGAFTFYFDTIRRVGEVFQSLVYTSVSLTENSYHVDNFRQVLEMKNIVVSGYKKISSKYPPKIEFKNVYFKYPGSDRYIFKNLSFTINPGEEIAIVGENGAGKSTLIKLICCFYYPSSGHIYINGVDTREVNLPSWYKHVAFLTQEFNNFGNMSLRNNVAIGNPNKKINEKKVLDALQNADAKFWKRYKAGLSTIMSQRYGGEEPSWGQWQKISIARIFYRNSSVMILDEPTASIDAVSEYKIFNQLYRSVKNKTLIIVSHRFSTVRNASRIIVLKKGKVVEEGGHAELLGQNGIYAKSFRLQAKGYR